MKIDIYKEDVLGKSKYLFDFDFQEPITGKSIVVIGDVHGNFDDLYNKLCDYTYTDIIYIVLGDSGLMNEHFLKFVESKCTFKHINDYLKIYNCKLFFGRGNHDNPFYFKSPSPNIFEEYSNIFSLPDHSILKFKNEFLFWIGGGLSIDRKSRRKDFTYFEDECVNFDFKLFKEIEKKYKPKFILSHGLPADAYPQTLSTLVLNYCESDKLLFNDLKNERENYSKTLKIFKNCIKWYSGHYHSSNGIVLHYHNEPTLCQNVNCIEFKEIYI